jgi:hypothetical protein
MHYVANVISRCFKSKSGIARVAMCVRNGAPRATCQRWQRLGGAGPVWARETQAQVGACCLFSERGCGLLGRVGETAARASGRRPRTERP